MRAFEALIESLSSDPALVVGYIMIEWSRSYEPGPTLAMNFFYLTT
jgi:hypothetical protein